MRCAFLSLTGCLALILAGCAVFAAEVPPPAVDSNGTVSGRTAVAVLAGGCFWGVEAVFQRVRGVTGEVPPATRAAAARTRKYEIVSSGRTGHAESVRISYDPAQVSYGSSCRFSSPSSTIRPSSTARVRITRPEYRSAIFYANPELSSASPKPTYGNSTPPMFSALRS